MLVRRIISCSALSDDRGESGGTIQVMPVHRHFVIKVWLSLRTLLKWVISHGFTQVCLTGPLFQLLLFSGHLKYCILNIFTSAFHCSFLAL